jgi:hypothetical protein
MNSVTAAQVLASARNHLNDDAGVLWRDAKLMPRLQEAHRELQLQMMLTGVPVLTTRSQVLSVPANTLDLSTVSNYPTNLVQPIAMYEKKVGQAVSSFVLMTETDDLPLIDQQTELLYWTWTEQTIKLLGATQANEVLLQYRKGITIPQTVNDTIGIYFGELFLSYRIAALAIQSKEPRQASIFNTDAKNAISSISRAAQKEMQNLPARRRGYHRTRNNYSVIREL